MPSRGSAEATAVARTTVSPVLTRAAPEACLAMRPVSKTSRLPPASSTATSCLDIESSFHCVRLGNLCVEGAGGCGQTGEERGERQGARKRVAKGVKCARGSGFSRPAGKSVCQPPHEGRAQLIAVHRPWQRVEFARYTMAPGPG